MAIRREVGGRRRGSGPSLPTIRGVYLAVRNLRNVSRVTVMNRESIMGRGLVRDPVMCSLDVVSIIKVVIRGNTKTRSRTNEGTICRDVRVGRIIMYRLDVRQSTPRIRTNNIEYDAPFFGFFLIYEQHRSPLRKTGVFPVRKIQVVPAWG